MKGRNLFLLGLLLGILCVVAVVLFKKVKPSKEEKVNQTTERSYSTTLAKEMTINNTIKVIGEFVPAVKQTIQFSLNGKLEKGDVNMQPGVRFKFNQLLYRVDIQVIFQELSSAKNQLSSSLKNVNADIERLFPSEKNKWKTFSEQVDPAKRLPDFPILNSDEERSFFRATPILKEYIKTAKLESEIEKHFYLAPFDGIVLEVNKKPGQNIRSGQKIAVIAKTGKLNVQLNCSESQAKELAAKESIVFTNEEGIKVGSGKFVKILKDKTASNRKNILCTFKAEMGFVPEMGKAVQTEMTIAETCFILPATSLRGNKVKILHNDQVIEREVSIIRSNKDSVYLKGLVENEIVILN